MSRRDGSEAPYRVVRRELSERILRGEFPPGSRLPSEAELVRDLGVSRQTVNKAISELAREGLVERNRRAGTTVSRAFHERFVLPLFDVSVDVERRGGVYRFALLDRALVANGEGPVHWHEVAQGAELLQLELVHFASDVPVLHELRYVNVAAASAVKEVSFEDVAPGRWLLDNVPWSSVRHRVSAVGCGAALGETLGLVPSTPCVVVERKTYHLGAPVTLVRLTLAGERLDIEGEYTMPTL